MKRGKRMAHINAKTDRVYYVLQMNLKCDADEATKWIKNLKHMCLKLIIGI